MYSLFAIEAKLIWKACHFAWCLVWRKVLAAKCLRRQFYTRWHIAENAKTGKSQSSFLFHFLLGKCNDFTLSRPSFVRNYCVVLQINASSREMPKNVLVTNEKRKLRRWKMFHIVIRWQPYIQLHNRTGEETIFRKLLIHISKQYITLYSNCQRTII